MLVSEITTYTWFSTDFFIAKLKKTSINLINLKLSIA